MLWALIAGSPNPDPAEEFGGVLGSMLGTGAAVFFLAKRWGKGRALLIVSLLAFFLLGYLVQAMVIGGATSARTSKVMMAFLIDVPRQTQDFSNEIAGLRIDTLFEMLAGKRAYQKSDLARMQNNISEAEKRTDEFRLYYENRISQAKRELADIDPAASADFMIGVNRSFPKMNEIYTRQEQYYQEVGALLKFALERSGHYEVTPKGIHFRDAGDRAAYNQQIDRIHDLASSINSMRAKVQETLESGVGRRGRDRTCDPQLRRLMLYPTELRARTSFILGDWGGIQ